MSSPVSKDSDRICVHPCLWFANGLGSILMSFPVFGVGDLLLEALVGFGARGGGFFFFSGTLYMGSSGVGDCLGLG